MIVHSVSFTGEDNVEINLRYPEAVVYLSFHPTCRGVEVLPYKFILAERKGVGKVTKQVGNFPTFVRGRTPTARYFKEYLDGRCFSSGSELDVVEVLLLGENEIGKIMVLFPRKWFSIITSLPAPRGKMVFHTFGCGTHNYSETKRTDIEIHIFQCPYCVEESLRG